MALAKAFPKLRIEIQDFPSLVSSYEQAVPDQLRSRVTFTPHTFFDPQPKPQDPEQHHNGHKTRYHKRAQRVYLLRHILHDWPTPDCHRILRNLIPSMSPSTRLIVAEGVMPSISYAASSSSSPTPDQKKKKKKKKRRKLQHQDPSTSTQHADNNSNAGVHHQNDTPTNRFNSAEQERIMRALDIQMLVQYGSQERSREDWERLFAGVGLEIIGTRKPKGSADTVMEVALK